MGRADLPVGAALGRSLWQRRSPLLVLGTLERAQYFVLARNSRGVQPALRLHFKGGEESASRRARRRGPGTTDQSGAKAASYLRQFLEHCAKTGSPLDFITFHAKGSPKVVEGHVQMGLGHNLGNVAKGYEVVASFPQFRKLPIVLSEYDPEGCAACSARDHPQNAYRNGTVYPTYTAASMKNILLLADRYQTNIAGMLTWALRIRGAALLRRLPHAGHQWNRQAGAQRLPHGRTAGRRYGQGNQQRSRRDQ